MQTDGEECSFGEEKQFHNNTHKKGEETDIFDFTINY